MSKKKDYSTTRVDFYYPGGATLTVGRIPNDKVYEYLDKLKNFKTDQKLCTSYSFTLNVYKYCDNYEQSLLIDANPWTLEPLCKVHKYSGCIRKIRNGTCKNPFIRDNIGKMFFPDKYKDDNQRG